MSSLALIGVAQIINTLFGALNGKCIPHRREKMKGIVRQMSMEHLGRLWHHIPTVVILSDMLSR